MASRLVGISGGLGRLGGAAGHVLGGGAHFVGCGGHLINLTVLLLHAGAGLRGNSGGLVGGAAGVLHRAFDLGNDRLQLVEETVEPAGQLAQFVLFGIGQAPGQVAFAAGDILKHVRHAEDWPGHAACHQPHQDQADHGGQQAQAQFQQGAFGVVGVQLVFQRFGGGDQDFFRYIQQYAPRLTAGNRRKRRQYLELVVGAQAAGLGTAGQGTGQLCAAGRVDLLQALAEFAGIRAVASQ
ncbi:hypothetical protein PFLmoz3_02646 [Pseudomonas fluorescens]|uniref:Uncharacterized protein n=1 Tax=Pseudomonas fluorescens TaxID=294 RepID=A0A109LHS3_PSEFL|nr:hypothetical protein PFLmoz3_02646 [Pseudomonas fluorescens]